jgi:serine protease Do
LRFYGWFLWVLVVGCERPNQPSHPKFTRDGGASGSETLSLAFGLPSFADLFQQVGPSVVSVTARHPLPLETPSFPGEPATARRVRSLGSGFVVDNNGHVVTCFSTVQGAEDIEVIRNDGRRIRTRLLASDTVFDIAILAIPPDLSPPPLPTAPLKFLRVGDWVAVIGVPFALSRSMTAGIVSAIHPPNSKTNDPGLILTDIAINPGCNGAPLLDLKGRVVGVVLVSNEPENARGLAIPIEGISPLLNSL